VAALAGVLVWRAVHDERPQVPTRIEGKRVRAPDFTLRRLDGGTKLALASLRGKGVVLNFWASWCAPCKEEIPALEQAWRDQRGRGLVFVGVDVEDAASDARSFARRHGITYPLVRDPHARLLTRYNVPHLPETLFVNRAGIIVGSRIVGGVHLSRNRAAFERGIELALRR
jgi:cytochrome c biogenesis protein CcmG/thiol:disulfide interchange protein DsbE